MNVEFVDTNVILYAYDPSAGERHRRALGLLSSLWERRAGALSTQVLQEFYVNVTRKIPAPLSPERAAEVIADLGEWLVVRPDIATITAAIKLSARFQLSFWDAMILAAASAAGARVVWSEDVSGGQDYGGVIVQNPFA